MAAKRISELSMKIPWEYRNGSATRVLEPRASVLSVSGTGALCVRPRRSPTQRAPGPDTESAGSAGPRHETAEAQRRERESAGARHRDRRPSTQRAPGPDRKTTGHRHKERESAGVRQRECLADTERAKPRHTSLKRAQRAVMLHTFGGQNGDFLSTKLLQLMVIRVN